MPNLCLQAIKMLNFKSYKGMHAITPFDKHFTAIVGPNGSGKSNIIDSILFVLGYKAKKMRHTNLKDLIHANCTECYVEIIFNKFAVKRSVNSSGQSRYFLSQVVSSEKEVRETKDEYYSGYKSDASFGEIEYTHISNSDLVIFLKENGIDLEHNRFLILQGEIESIAMMNPMELLNYIEDCIGTASYQKSIEKLSDERNLEITRLEELSDQLKFQENEYSFKRAKKEEKIKIIKDRQTNLRLKNRITKLKQLYSTKYRREIEIERQKKMEKMNELLKDQSLNARKLEELSSNSHGLSERRYKELETMFLNEKSNIQKLERENKFNLLTKTRLEKEIKSAHNEIRDYKLKVEDYEKEKIALDAEQTALGKLVYETNIQIDKIQKSIEEKSRLDPRYREYEEKKKNLESELAVVFEKMNIYSKKISELEYYNIRKKEIESYSDVEPKQINELENEISTIEKDLVKTNEEIYNRKRHAEEFKNVEYQYKREAEVIKKIKHVNGYCGPLKSLGIIKKGYEVAVEAATSSMNSIVVETTLAAEESISILNSNKLARTTFIIIEKLNVMSPENNDKQLLRNVIKCELKYQQCFQYALGDTLVVEDLETARSLAFSRVRRRVVTIDGKLFEKSGVMTGGKVSKKLKSIDELENIYRNMKNLLNKRKIELSNIKNQAFLKDEVKELVRKNIQCLKECLSLIPKSTQDIENNGAGRHILKLNSEQDIVEDQFTIIASLKQIISNCEDNIDRIKSQIKKYETYEDAGMMEMKNKLLMEFDKLNAAEKRIQEIKIKLNSKVQRVDVNIEVLEHEIENCKIIDIDYEKLRRFEVEYKKMYEEYQVKQETILKLRNGIGKYYHEEARIKEELEELSDEITECNKVSQECMDMSTEIKNEMKIITSLLIKEVENEEISSENRGDKPKRSNKHKLKSVKSYEKSNEESKNDNISSEMSLSENEESNYLENLKNKIEKLVKKFRKNEKNQERDSLDDIQMYRIIFMEFEEAKGTYEKMKSKKSFLEGKIIELNNSIEKLINERLEKFMEGFKQINGYIKSIFNILTFGGNAELDLVDFLDPFSEGIKLSIMPPKKAWKNISNLSGGEKTLSSLSLIFALHRYRPSSFYIMDEIDAALDYKNVSIISQYLKQIDAQFIIISLRNDMFEMAGTLLGVYKLNEISKFIIVNLENLKL